MTVSTDLSGGSKCLRIRMFLRFLVLPGGKEGVLVVWQLDTGKKKFLPRIGSPLLYFINSPDPTLSSVRFIRYLDCSFSQLHNASIE